MAEPNNPLSDTESAYHRNGTRLLARASILTAFVLFGWWGMAVFLALKVVEIIIFFGLSYFASRNVNPRPIQIKVSADFPDTSQVRFHEHNGSDFRSRYVYTAPYVLFPRNWQETFEADKEQLVNILLHEIGHCKSKDLPGLITWFSVVLPSAIVFIALSVVAFQLNFSAEGLWTPLTLVICGAILSAVYVVFQFRGLLLSFEYHADAFAHEADLTDYKAFLEDAAFLEQYSTPNVGTDKTFLRRVKRYLHPTFESRLNYLENGSIYTLKQRVIDGFTFSYIILFPLVLFLALADNVPIWGPYETLAFDAVSVYFQVFFALYIFKNLSDFIAYYHKSHQEKYLRTTVRGFDIGWSLAVLSLFCAVYFSLNGGVLLLIKMAVVYVILAIMTAFLSRWTIYLQGQRGAIWLGQHVVAGVLAGAFMIVWFLLFPSSFGLWFMVGAVAFLIIHEALQSIAGAALLAVIGERFGYSREYLMEHYHPDDYEHFARTIGSPFLSNISRRAHEVRFHKRPRD